MTPEEGKELIAEFLLALVKAGIVGFIFLLIVVYLLSLFYWAFKKEGEKSGKN